MKRIDVTKYGILPNTDELLTKKIQKLINELSDGDELYFPKGKYVLSTIFLKSNITIHLSSGAFLLGSLNFYDYEKLEKVDYPLYQDVSHSYFHCSMFVGEHLDNISIIGKGTIDMRSVWDEDNVNQIVHRGAKVISLKECNHVLIEGINIKNATDLAVYFASCNHVIIRRLNLRVYIDGISPDNSKDVLIEDCDVYSGDDGIVFKSSYNLNKLDECNNVIVRNCRIKSRCYCIKFGTESNGGFKDFYIHDISMKDTRIGGIAIESTDGAIINNIKIERIKMINVNAPLYVMLGGRLRGPAGSKIGKVSNITISDLEARGPFKTYRTIAWNYISFKNKMITQFHWNYHGQEHIKPTKEMKEKPWQFTSNLCGYPNYYLENITLKNFYIEVDGGVKKGQYVEEIKDRNDGYPEVYANGWILPASGIYFRHIKNLTLDNIKIVPLHEDERETMIFDDVI